MTAIRPKRNYVTTLLLRIACAIGLAALPNPSLDAQTEDAGRGYLGICFGNTPGKIWSAVKDGIQTSIALNFGNIPYPSSWQQLDGTIKSQMISAPPGTKPFLAVQVYVKNVSDKPVFVLADKSRSGNDPPSYMKVYVQALTDSQSALNLHPFPFYRQQFRGLEPGKWTFFNERIPYASLISLKKNDKICVSIAIAHAKPPQFQQTKPEVLIWSDAIEIPWDQLRPYLDINKSL